MRAMISMPMGGKTKEEVCRAGFEEWMRKEIDE